MIPLIVSLTLGTPFIDRWPKAEMPLHSYREFWRAPHARIVEPPPDHYYFGKGELLGHCFWVSEIGVKCKWEWARV